jgi:hypothetical protein
MSLVTVIEQFQEVGDAQREKLEQIYIDLKEDDTNSIAMSIVQSIERSEISSKKDLYELMESLKTYKSQEVDSVLDLGYDYDFSPPGDEFPLEYSDALDKQRLLTITPEGKWMEVDNDGQEIGPVDSNHNPAEGHPEYVKIGLDLSPAHTTTLELPQALVDIPTEQLEQLVAGFAGAPSSPKFDDQAPLPPHTSGWKSPSSMPELQEVLLETEIGSLMFEPEMAMYTGRSFVMTFDMTRSKPPLYPRVGSNFRLKYKQHDLAVTYMDISFTYKNRKFMIFIVLDED